ncbi:bacteriocin immunity protein [Lactobacillus sp. CBA3606]|uniref:bacteriocin immunity protein n=1 Tax=Lactobacillus sp. CBA3606 TaxID=2099789 RepID=UPI001319D3BA|nr:bacteriocin immunity protein [Lactobacillus sp. CBA3606]
MDKPTKAIVTSAARVTLLTDQLSAAYAEAQQADDQALQKLLLTHAIALNNGTPYLEVINQLTHAISGYYVHYHQVPPAVLAIYRGLQADVTAGTIDAAALRKRNLATGLSLAPITFEGC